MRSIESAQNIKYKGWKQLLTPRGRKKEGAFLVESRKLTAEALLAGLELETLIFRKSDANLLKDKLLDHLIKRGQIERDPLGELFDRAFVLPDSLFSKISQMEASDGVLAVIKGSLKKSFSEEEGKAIKGKCILLDHIQDPGNAGAILRSAEAFGFGPILLVDCVDVENEKCLRSSMGAAFRLDLYTLSEDQALSLKKNPCLPWYGADMEGEDYRTLEVPESLMLLIGNEGQGLRPSFEKALEKRVSIPMNEPVESLNAAISASILMASFRYFALKGL